MLKRWLPVGVLVAGLIAFFALGLDRYISFETLKTHRAALLDFVGANPLGAVLLYGLAYVAVVAFSLPGGAVMTVTGGFLFGTALATAVVVVAATVGAALVFLAAKTALGDVLRNRAGPFLARMEEGFRANALSYLLVLRLVPLFPFFIVNLVPAFLGVTLRVFVVGTLIGIVPGTFVYASVGAGLGSVFDAGESFSARGVLTPEVVLALVGFAFLAMIPVLYRRFRSKESRGGSTT
jgi:uncharacterized membrane protein YdjX (TVP38/TMEM64 family)